MRRTVVVLSAALTLVTLGACGATMIQSAGADGSRYAPLDDGRRMGLVKYQIDDENFFVKRRREDAYKKMYQSCGGPYYIVAEGARIENGRVITTVTETSAAVKTRDATSSERQSERRPTSGDRDTVTAVAEHTTETTHAVVGEQWWYVQYRCATAADTSGR